MQTLQTKTTLAKLREVHVWPFAFAAGLTFDKRVEDFLKQHNIVTIGTLLDTSVLNESNPTWRALGGLRNELKRLGFARGKREYPFLITTI